MANIKTYSIQINGIKESTAAVDALSASLDNLDKKIKSMEGKSVGVGSKAGGASKSALSEEEKLEKQIAQIDEKRVAYSKEIYQNYLAAKDLLDEQVKDQKQLAAAERLRVNSYSNTMKGMKEKLKDVQIIRNTTDVASDKFKELTEEANRLTENLKELEAQTGSYGRNVGNYASAFDKIKVAVGDTVREYANYRQAIKELKQERFKLSETLGQESQEYKNIDQAVKQLESDYNDLNKSSRFMDNLLDTMQSFTALASVGQGFSALFGVDESKIQKTIKNLLALQNILKGIETLNLQIQRKEGIGRWLADSSKGIDNFVAKLTNAKNGVDGLTASTTKGTMAIRGLSMAIKGFAFAGFIFLLKMVSDAFERLSQAMQVTKLRSEALEEATNKLTRAFKERNDELTSSYLKGEISSEEFLTNQYDLQANYLSQQIALLRERAAIMNDKSWYEQIYNVLGPSGPSGTAFTGSHMTGSKTIGAGNFVFGSSNDFKMTVNNIEEVEKAFRQCQEAIREGKDYFDKWGHGLFDWANSLLVTVSDTREVMKGLGNTRLSDFIADFEDVVKQMDDGKLTAEQFGEELKRLKTEFTNNDVLQSVYFNLDKYIDDDAFRMKVEAIIEQIFKLNDAFNMTSPEQIRHWAQVRIDAMKEGIDKTMAQIKADEDYEIAQYAKTEEQKTLIQAKYNRKRQEASDRAAKERHTKAQENDRKLIEAENDLNRLRIEAMKDGLAKVLAQLEQEKKERLQKVKDSGIKVQERSLLIEEIYNKKILDAKKKWAADMQKVYEDLYYNIQQINRATFSMETNTASMNVQNRTNTQIDEAGSVINGTNYKDPATLEAYFKKVLDIEKKAADSEVQIQKEKLDKELEYNKEQENLRHKRMVDENGELKKQLEDQKITQEQYDKLLEDENNAHNSRMNALDKEFAAQNEQIARQHLDKKRKSYSDYYTNTINLIRQKQEEINYEMTKANVYDKAGFGIVNLKQTYKNYDNLIAKEKDTIEKIKQEREKLNKDQKNMDAKAFKARQEELDASERAAMQTLENLETASANVFTNFVNKLNQYIQAVGQTVQGIFQAVWDYQDYMFEKEQNELDKWNEELQDAYNKQEEMLSEHKNNVDAIEDELSTARGDRRQSLVDQLNAEMAAERAAAKEKQRIEKEQEKAKKKQEALDKKRREAEHDRDVKQAFISWHLSIANGLATQPFLPVGIAMGALATALGAVQYALVKSQKPYAKGGQLEGGVAQGPRHRDGGIPVLGGRASIEGGEFITNRLSTEKNIDLLEFINSKKKKVDVSDLIDFYSSGNVKKNISGIRTKFEDGGYVQPLPNIDVFDDDLRQSFERYSNRPVVVSVVDINNKQADVKRVQTLAGL